MGLLDPGHEPPLFPLRTSQRSRRCPTVPVLPVVQGSPSRLETRGLLGWNREKAARASRGRRNFFLDSTWSLDDYCLFYDFYDWKRFDYF